MKKLRNKKGFSLVEMLLATLLLAILSSIAMVTTSVIFGTGTDMKVIAKAEVLGSEVLNVIKNEMRFCEKLDVSDDGKISFSSVSYGANTSISLETDGRMYFTSDGLGKDVKFYPIGNTVYDEVKIKDLTFTKNGSGVDVTVKITSDGTNEIYSSTIAVSMLNLGKE